MIEDNGFDVVPHRLISMTGPTKSQTLYLCECRPMLCMNMHALTLMFHYVKIYVKPDTILCCAQVIYL